MPDFCLHKQLNADSVLIRNLPLSQLRLQNQREAPWLILVPRVPDAREIHDLSASERALLIDEIALASKALTRLYSPDKINVGALGNIVPQLHVHVIARFKRDMAWPDPVWGKLPPAPYLLQALTETKQRLNDDALWG